MKTLRNYFSVCAFLICAVFTVASFSSCGDDDDEDGGGGSRSSLVGTWVDGETTMILHSDGTGEFEYENYEWGENERYFTWEATDIMFILDRGDWGLKSSYIYFIEGNVLTLTDTGDGNIITYVKR